MRFIFIAIFLFITSCAEMLESLNCSEPSYEEQDMAKFLYNDFFTSKVSMSYEKGKKIFGCHFHEGDEVYSYKRIFDQGYVLVRNYKAITYHAASD